jgi:hypothetical protein
MKYNIILSFHDVVTLQVCSFKNFFFLYILHYSEISFKIASQSKGVISYDCKQQWMPPRSINLLISTLQNMSDFELVTNIKMVCSNKQHAIVALFSILFNNQVPYKNAQEKQLKGVKTNTRLIKNINNKKKIGIFN